MRRCLTRHTARAFAFAGVIGLLAALAVAPAGARPAKPPVVDIQPGAWLAPDARSISVQVLASCPERWTVAEAVVTIRQPHGSGSASFPLTCIGSLRPFGVTVPATVGTFELGEAQVTASVVVERGRTQSTQDAQDVEAQPAVLVELAGSAQLESGGGAVVLDVAVACPAGTTGLRSTLHVSQGPAAGNGFYVPVCDGATHAFAVRVEASQGAYVPGIAQALTFAGVEFEGDTFFGIDDDGALEVVD
ncbi:MAG TPA: hypothetical protein VFR63_13350 [Gaiellaceae bacterium]|jgi:hypothetical protein|nr:hypothetical protein [Gaiellaceae bacterium]